MFAQATEIWLLRTEQTLRDRITAGDIPFLGLYSGLFKDSSRKRILDALKAARDPVSTFVRAMAKWPATFATHLTIHVVEGFGASGDAAVYPFVSTAIFGKPRDLAPADRDRVWQSYRRACLRLGLEVLGEGAVTNYKVGEYLHQAGVPVKFLDRIAIKMLRHAADAGVPESDDLQGIDLWQTTLLDKLNAPIPVTARRAVEADRGHYYTRAFLRVLAGEPADPERPDRVTYETFSDVLADKESERADALTRRLTIPRVVLREDLLGVELPADGEASWRISVDDVPHTYAGSPEPRFVPFDFPPLPGRVQIQGVEHRWTQDLALWEDGRNNRLLAFNAAGLLTGSAKLNSDSPLQVEPGPQTLVCRFKPDGYDSTLREISSDPSLYALTLDLAPGEQLQLRRGPAHIILLARSRPSLTLRGQAFKGIGGNELLASHDLTLGVRIPREIIDETEGGLFELELASPALGEPIVVLVTPDINGHVELECQSLIVPWKPGLGRLAVELRRSGHRRAIGRTAAWVWNGLNLIRARSRFECSRLPANLDRESCDNLIIDEENATLGYRSDQKRYFHLVFHGTAGRAVRFSGAVPGTFMILSRFTEEQVIQQPLRRGAILAVPESSREVLDVFSSEGGTLVLGAMRHDIPLRTGSRRLHVSSLAQFLSPGNNTLRIESADGTAAPLLQLVAPHRVMSMEQTIRDGIFRIQLRMPAAADGMRGLATDMLSGCTKELDLSCNDVTGRLSVESLAWLECSARLPDGSYLNTIELPLERWPGGAWVLEVEVRLNGRWGTCVNSRSDIYAWGFMAGHMTPAQLRPWIAANMACDRAEDTRAIFERVHRALLICYAGDAWTSLQWLATLWRAVLEPLKALSGNSAIHRALVDCDAMAPSATDQPGWFPILGVGAVTPWIYARGAREYRRLGRDARMLAALAEVGPELCQLYIQHWLEQTSAFGFGNVMAMQHGTPPKDFSMDRLRAALGMRNIDDAWSLLSDEDWRPVEGDYLGPVHWRYAFSALSNRYRRTLLGNQRRRGWALQLLRSTWNASLADFATGLPAHLDVARGLGELHGGSAEPEDQTVLNLLDFDRFLCLFAGVCRWEARMPGTLDAWCARLGTAALPDDESLEMALGYLLHIGRECFEFYLLLWELVFAADWDTLGGEATDA